MPVKQTHFVSALLFVNLYVVIKCTYNILKSNAPKIFVYLQIVKLQQDQQHKEKALEQASTFRRRKKQHQAVESNINKLEHRELNRYPDRTRSNLERYIGLAVTAYNLHKIGKQRLSVRREEEKQQQRLGLAA